jgi:hypothetical protein
LSVFAEPELQAVRVENDWLAMVYRCEAIVGVGSEGGELSLAGGGVILRDRSEKDEWSFSVSDKKWFFGFRPRRSLPLVVAVSRHYASTEEVRLAKVSSAGDGLSSGIDRAQRSVAVVGVGLL